MLNEMKTLLKQQNMCVLATVGNQTPHCSLMAYVTNEQGDEIYLVTHKNTHKYSNLKQNPNVSILIDTRGQGPRSETRALTVVGQFHRFANETAAQSARERLLSTHPHLKGFIDHPDAAIIRISIKSFLLLEGLTQAHFETL